MDGRSTRPCLHPVIIDLLAWEPNTFGTDVHTVGAVWRPKLSRFRCSARQFCRESHTGEIIYRPDQIATGPFTCWSHVVSREYAKASSTSPLRHPVPKGGVLARAGVCRQEPNSTPKGENLTRKLPFPVALGPRGRSMLVVMPVVIKANTLSCPTPAEVGQPSMN